MVIGLVLGAAAYLLVQGYASHVRMLQRDLGHPVRVVVAAVDAERGAVLDDSMVSVSRWPSAYVPPGAVHRSDWIGGRVLLSALRKGEILTVSRLAPRGGAVASLIPPGLRAAAVPSTLPPGAVSPGDRVDVLATFPGARAHIETVASALQVIRVVAPTETDVSGGGPGAPTAVLVLLVAPDQAEELAYARAFADVSITLDGPQEW